MTVRKTEGPGGRTEPLRPDVARPSASTPSSPVTPAREAADAFARSTGAGAPTIFSGDSRAELAAPVTSGRSASQPPFGSAAFEERLDKSTRSLAREGNRVQLLFDGVNSFPERRRLIEGAKGSIHLQTFIFSSDDTGWDLARSLVKRAQEGVKVRVIYDGMGSNRSDGELFDYMERNGVEVREYGDPLTYPLAINDRWHEKHLIVDGRVSIEGGMNIANEYALGGSGKRVFTRGEEGTEPWRDADARIEGPAVQDAQAAFLKNWATLGDAVPDAERAAPLPATEPRGSVKVRVVQHRPDQERDKNTHALYLQAIRSARESITIENAYFLPPEDLRKALCAAARRGVEVKVMTNGRESNDLGIVSDAARYFYDDLISAGVKLYEKQGGTLHAKTATFDGVYSIVGSVNLNGRSEGQDSEIAVAIDDGVTALSLQRRFDEGLSQTRQVTAEELREEDFFTNLEQFSLSLLAWTF